MRTSFALCGASLHLEWNRFLKNPHFRVSMCKSPFFLVPGARMRRKQLREMVTKAKSGRPRKKQPWWERLFSEESDDGWLSMNDDGLVEEIYESEEEGGEDEKSIEERKFEAWKSRAEALTELRDAQEEARNAENKEWEDWLGESYSPDASGSSWDWDQNGEVGGGSGESSKSFDEMMPEQGLIRSIRNLILRNDDDLLFEDRVFQYASVNSAKFLAVLILVPWAIDFAIHDFVLMPFLDRYVKTVPLAAELLDVRKYQKLDMVKSIKIERERLRFEEEIGKAPPLSDDEIWLELREKAIELRDEWRLENRKAFANIWSDMVYGITLFLLIYFNQSRVALLKFTGYKLLNNISDTGKAFLIILITDIFLGYHSESGWEALVEIILEHYGLEVDKAAITVFVCFIPVVIDACVKLWLFKFLPRLSPNVTNIFREMKRH